MKTRENRAKNKGLYRSGRIFGRNGWGERGWLTTPDNVRDFNLGYADGEAEAGDKSKSIRQAEQAKTTGEFLQTHAKDAPVEDLTHLPPSHPDHPYQNGHEDDSVPPGAKKYDGGKAPVMQGCIERFPLALEQVSRVSEYGARKYGSYDGWEKLPDALNRYNDAGGRHTLLRSSEGEYDVNDSGLPHLAQRAWNALATLELALREEVIEMTDGNSIENGEPVLGSNGRNNDPVDSNTAG